MKKFVIVSLVLFLIGVLLGVAFPAWAFGDDEYPTDWSMSATMNSDDSVHKRVSLDFLWRPEKVAWGVSVNNSRHSGYFKKTPIAIETLDISALIGYWSNKEKKHLLGWHTYIGVGFSAVDVRSKEYEALRSVATNAKFGLGLDLYLIRKPQKYSLAITAELLNVSQTMKLRSRTDGAFYEVTPMHLSNQIGVRLWF